MMGRLVISKGYTFGVSFETAALGASVNGPKAQTTGIPQRLRPSVLIEDMA
jgi:hypothetical protein